MFVTAFNQYALDAFQVNAVDYLLKPVNPARLDQALGRGRSRLELRRAGVVYAQALTQIVEALRRGRRGGHTGRQGGRPRFARSRRGPHLRLVERSEVAVVASQVTGTSDYRTLDEVQAQLDQAVFWRVHRSYLVNINKIKEMVPWFSRKFILRMRDAK